MNPKKIYPVKGNSRYHVTIECKSGSEKNKYFLLRISNATPKLRWKFIQVPHHPISVQDFDSVVGFIEFTWDLSTNNWNPDDTEVSELNEYIDKNDYIGHGETGGDSRIYSIDIPLDHSKRTYQILSWTPQIKHKHFLSESYLEDASHTDAHDVDDPRRPD